MLLGEADELPQIDECAAVAVPQLSPDDSPGMADAGGSLGLVVSVGAAIRLTRQALHQERHRGIVSGKEQVLHLQNPRDALADAVTLFGFSSSRIGRDSRASGYRPTIAAAEAAPTGGAISAQPVSISAHLSPRSAVLPDWEYLHTCRSGPPLFNSSQKYDGIAVAMVGGVVPGSG
jgi:hypothetical protein